MKWGDIPADHLAMMDFPADTNAAAVILGDFGETYFLNWNQVYKVHRRVKLLRESSYDDFGTINIVYPIGKNGARMRDLKAQTIVAGPDGKPVVHRVDRGSFFKERLEADRERLSFTFPALQPGAIVEFTYEMNLPSVFYLEPWVFQTHEPVLHSEYRIEYPGELQYVISSVGNALGNLSVNEADRATRPRGIFSTHRWVMENIPALREEPYMTTPKDYNMAIRFQLSAVRIPGVGVESFMNTWPKVAEDFMDARGLFGQYLRSPGRDVRRAAEEAVGEATEPVDKMVRVYDYVRTRVDYNGDMGISPDRSPKDVLQRGTGSSPDIALLLVAMLREAGLDAHPVLLSTRDHGHPNSGYPILAQFNDVIAAVEIGSERHLLDATDRQRPHDMLPFRSLNGEAWMVRHPDPAWIPVEATHRQVEQRFVVMDIKEDGQASGQVQATDAGYAALFARHELDGTADHTEYAREHLFDKVDALNLSAVEVANPENVSEPVTVKADFTIDGFAQSAGDFLYVTPMFLDRLAENPFRAPERQFPVDMGYGRDQIYTATVTIPEGYVVSEVPTNKQFGIEGGGVIYRSGFEVEGRTIRVMRRLTIAKSVFPETQYAALRGFYDRIVSAMGEQIVLQRASAEAAAGE